MINAQLKTFNGSSTIMSHDSKTGKLKKFCRIFYNNNEIINKYIYEKEGNQDIERSEGQVKISPAQIDGIKKTINKYKTIKVMVEG